MSDVQIDRKEVIVSEGDLPCLLVYSDQKHVGYINEVLSIAEESLRQHGFRPQRLSTEIRSGEDYFSKISSLIDSCALILVVLDGLRPNVVFEFGFAEARRKPTIIIRTKGSTISVKTLYMTLGETGLSNLEFERLRDPPLDPPSHLSDFAGKQIPVIDRTANETEYDHPSLVLKRELTHQKSIILEEIQKIKTQDIDTNVLNEASPHLTKVIRLYYSEDDFEVQDLKNTVDEIYRISANHRQQLPKEIVSMAGSALVRLAKRQTNRNETELAVKTLNAGSDIYNKLSRVI